MQKIQLNSLSKILCALSFLLCTVVAQAESMTVHPYEPQDPLQTVNRGFFAFNQEFDRFVLKPLATGYKTVTPAPVRDGVNNFYWNLDEIPTAANNLLQIKPKPFLNGLARLAINSTIGILGIFDVASHVGFPRTENDFGITLAHYGFTSSPYLVLPFLGPSNVRDGLGLGVDYSFFTVWPYMRSVSLRNTLLGFDYIRIRANYLGNEDVLKVAALDKYTMVRDAYMQRRTLEMAQHGTVWDQGKAYSDAGGEADESDADFSVDEAWALNAGAAAKPPLAKAANPMPVGEPVATENTALVKNKTELNKKE